MASILEKFGVKEVMDFTLYEINANGTPGDPVLYLDSLKVSTTEQTADQSEAKGGKGNLPLVIWDFGKEITLNLEDALFSPKSMAIMMGNGRLKKKETVMRTLSWIGKKYPKVWKAPDGREIPIFEDKNGVLINSKNAKIFDEDKRMNGEDPVISFSDLDTALKDGGSYIMTWEEKIVGNTIEIAPDSFPGTYYAVGDTYARSAITGKDEFFQLIVPKAKMSPERTLTFQAEGDPSTFNMSLRVMRPESGNMMELVQYTLDDTVAEENGGLEEDETP